MKASTLFTPVACCSGAARGEDHRRACAPEQPRRLDQLALRHTRQHFDALGPVGRRQPPHLLEAFGALADVVGVDLRLADEQVQQTIGKRRVGPRPQTQMHRRPLRRRRAPRIGDDQRAAVALLRLEVPHDRRHRLGQIGPDEQNRFGARNVFERKRQAAIDAERARRSRGRRRHAEPAVVVDVRRAERHPRELAEQVRLLVGQRPAAEDADRIASVSRRGRGETPKRCDRARHPIRQAPVRRLRRARAE